MNCGMTSEDIFTFPTNIEITIIVIPMLNDWPVSRIVLVVADAIPKYFFSTEPMMTFILGEENIPNPIPSKIAIKIIARIGVAGVRKNIKANPKTIIAIPKVANMRASTLSDQRPARSDNIACEMGCTINIKPA